MDKELIIKIQNALEFYANCEHFFDLTGKVVRDNNSTWKAEAKKLEEKNYVRVGEDERGNEEFVEQGRVAQLALLYLNKYLENADTL